MSAQDVIMDARVAHVRELKAEIARLRDANRALQTENAALKAHFDLALVAAQDLRELESGEKLVIFDGWNLILGSPRSAKDREDLLHQAEALVAERGGRAWIVLDGHDERVTSRGKVRVSYTGGTGSHRADRFICDFLRMAAYLGLSDRVEVRTNDKDFIKDIKRIGELT